MVQKHLVHRFFALVLCTFALRNSMLGAPGENAPSADRPCAVHLTSTGGFWKGELFADFQEVESADRSAIFDRVARALAGLENLTITSTSKETGTVSGQAMFSPVMGGTPRPAPVNVVVKEREGGGTRVEITLSVPPGSKAVRKVVEGSFCKVLEAGAQAAFAGTSEQPGTVASSFLALGAKGSYAEAETLLSESSKKYFKGQLEGAFKGKKGAAGGLFDGVDVLSEEVKGETARVTCRIRYTDRTNATEDVTLVLESGHWKLD